MNWIEINKADFQPINCVNTRLSKYHLGFSPIDIPIKEQTDDIHEPQFDMKYIQVIHKGGVTVDNLKEYLIKLINDYDDSFDCNYFIINNNKAVLRKASRVGLRDSLKIQKDKGETNATLWLETNNGLKEYILPIDYIQQMLIDLELFAIKCNNTTQSHLSNVPNLLTKLEVLNYDITQGYPEHLVFNTNIE